MAVLCRNGTEHSHDSVEESKICWGILKPPAPPSVPVRPHSHDVATDRQLEYIKLLGGDVSLAENYTKADASRYIDRLKGAPVSQPATPRAVYKTKVPLALLEFVEDGYYAVQPDSETAYVFLRVSRPTRGRMAGSLKVQTQHSDVLATEFVQWPSGEVSVYKRSIEDQILLLLSDHHTAARNYGRHIGRCCRCNKTLTDERSRHYGIGPECEQYWPYIISLVDEEDAG